MLAKTYDTPAELLNRNLNLGTVLRVKETDALTVPIRRKMMPKLGVQAVNMEVQRVFEFSEEAMNNIKTRLSDVVLAGSGVLLKLPRQAAPEKQWFDLAA